MSTREDIRASRHAQGQAARERVLSGQYLQPKQETASEGQSLRDRIRARSLDAPAPAAAPFTPIPAFVPKSTQPNFLQPQPAMGSPAALQQFKQTAPPPKPALPGRDIPIIGPVLKGLDKVQQFTEPAAKIAEELYTPGAGLAAMGAFRGAGEALLGRVAPKIAAGTGLGARVVKEAALEGAMGAPLGAGQAAARHPEDMRGIGEGAAIGALGGAALGALSPIAGQAVRSIANRLRPPAPNPGTAVTSPMGEFGIPNVTSRELTVQPQPVRGPRALPSPQRVDVTPQAETFAPRPRIDVTPPAERPAAASPLRQEPEILNASTAPRVDVTPPAAADDIIEAVKEPRIRDRVYAKLDAAEQAARKRIAARRGNLSSTPLPEYGDMAIIMAAKTGKGAIKAADFTEDLVREFGEAARPHAAKVLRATREALRREERAASEEGQRAAAFNAQTGGDADSFMGKISNEKPKRTKDLKAKSERFLTQMDDDLRAFETLEKNVRGGKLADAKDSLYKSARNFRGMPAKAAQIVRERLTPIARDVEKAGYSMDDLGAYALARHAKDVNAAGYKSGFTDAEIESVLQRFGTDDMERIRGDLIKINDDMLGSQEGGLAAPELVAALRERWPNYIPLFRELDSDAVGFSGGLSDTLANVTSPIKKLKGSEKAVINPMENMVKNVYQTVNAVERNKVAAQIQKLAALDPDEVYMRKLKPDEKSNDKNVVNVKVNGEPVRYEVQPEVYKAFMNLDKESSNILMNVLAAPAKLLRAGATLTPEFALRNPFRDVIQAFVVSKSGFNPLIDFPVGIIQSIKKGDLYKEWVDQMGDFGNSLSMDRNAHKEALDSILKQPPSKKYLNIINPKAWLKVLRAISDTTESATKVGEYRAALRKGVSKEEAAFRSRDIMDFGRAGSSIRVTNRVVAFLNANIQGKSKLIRAAKEDPVGVATRAFVSITLPTMGIWMMQRYMANETQTQTITEAPNWVKDSFWLIPIPGTDIVARLPKPFDLAPIFANSTEKALDFAYNKDKDAFDGFAQRTLTGAALPAQLTGLVPLIEGMANYSFFRQGQIIPQREEGLEFKDQYDPVRTTEAAKLIGKGVDSLTGGKGPFKNFGSPRIVDNTLQGLTAGLGTYATSAIDSLLQGKVLGQKVLPAVVDRPNAPEKRLEQKPFAKAFTVDPLQGGASMDKLYAKKDELTKKKASAKLNKSPFKEAAELARLSAAADRMAAINKQVRTIEANKTLSAAAKRDKIESLITTRNKLAISAVKSPTK